MRKFILLGLILNGFISFTANAQDNALAIDYYWLGDLQTSKKLFEQSASQLPDMSYYYLGEIAANNKNIDEARTNYQKGVSANPEATYSKIGLLKLDLKSNTKEATKGLNDIAKKNKKDVLVVVEAARAFYENGMVAEGDKVLEDARKNNGKSAWPYILAGDRLVKMGKAGDASGQYDQAIHFDPKNTVAYIKSAQIYANTNSTVAINQLKEALASDPNNLIANKFLAEMYYKHGFYPEAIASYENYFQKGNKSVDDLTNYAASLYFSKNYDGAIKSLNEALVLSPNDRVLNRLLMYTYNKMGKYTDAQPVGDRLFQLPSIENEGSYLLEDYLIYANVLNENGQHAKAIQQYRKAIELDKANKDLYKELADALAKDNKLIEAGDEIQKYIDIAETKEAADYLQMGIYYYQAAGSVAKSTDEAEKAKLPAYVAKADAAFGKVIELNPESFQGYYWRANANTLLDPDLSKGLANADYEKTISVIEGANNGDANKSRLIEAYRYFAIYYLYQYDANKKADVKDKAKEYASKVLTLNPNDATAKQVADYLNQ